MKFSTNDVLVLAAAALLAVFLIVLSYFSLEEHRAKHLTEAAAKGADPVALSCAMGRQEACAAWAARKKEMK